ncbi:MAG: carbamate kinase [Acidimicrobiia bacterium]|nr:MAG: carbamate kinase [Acidimicrobiia bacterium]
MITLWDGAGGPPVVAFGGNALLPGGEEPGAAARNAAAFAEVVLQLLSPDAGLVLVHGNGPQVGEALIRNEAAATEAPPSPLDVLVAETQGGIGYLLERALLNALSRVGAPRPVVTVVTQVVVDPDHPAMAQPTKPVGPFYPAGHGASVAAVRGWTMVDVPGRGLRRVVPSPPPIEVVETPSIRALAEAGAVVIAGGGGGIPVARHSGELRGVEGVIDKDRTAALIARSMDACGLLILTEVDNVYTGFGTERQAVLRRAAAAEARRLLAEGEFPPGSMGPKVEAAADFAETTGRDAVITSVAAFGDTLAGTAGTRITP